MGAIVIQMPPSFDEPWWTTEPQLHSWELPQTPALEAVERRQNLRPLSSLELVRGDR